MRIYCIEDDLLFGRMLKHRLSLDPEFDVTLFQSAKNFDKQLSVPPDIITMDINLPDADGVELLKLIREKLPDIPVLAISGQEDVKTAVSLFRLGLYDYIVKDDNTLDRLWHVIHNAAKQKLLDNEVKVLRQEVNEKYNLDSEIKGSSEEMQRVFERIKKSLNSDINVSITGETGTGKELVAKTIHFNSTRRSGPFVPVNVAAIPTELVESEMFGHEKGAFTGAQQRRIGKFEQAKGGTLFLDEIGEMNPAIQAKLLRVLQEMEVTRVGGSEPVSLDFRLIIATHKDLLEEVKEGRFREDLYYRLLGLAVQLPPLRDRNKDVILLANYFGDQFAKKNNLPPKKLSIQAKEALLNYTFPGNIRELKSIIESAYVIGDSDQIEEQDLNMRIDHEIGLGYKKGFTLSQYMTEIIQQCLRDNDNNVVKTAQKLNIGKSTIYRYAKEGLIKL